MTGKTVDEAIEKALAKLGVGIDDVEVVVLDRGRGGILGIGAEEARVQVMPRQVDLIDLAKETIESLLRAMGVSATVGLPETSASKAPSATAGSLAFNIDGEDAGLLIGRRGETLSALQFIVNFILSRKSQKRTIIDIDVEDYRARRYESLRNLALRMAERVAQTGRPFIMEPMPARERRIVHLALTDHPRVTTESVGEGEARQVTVVPKHGPRPPQHRDDRPRHLERPPERMPDD